MHVGSADLRAVDPRPTTARRMYYNDFQISDDCLTAVTARMTQRNVVEQRVAEANFQGKLADMPAGELRGAFGVEHALERERVRARCVVPRDGARLAARPTSTRSTARSCCRSSASSSSRSARATRISRPATSSSTRNRTRRCSTGRRRTDFRFRGGWQRANRTPNVAELYSGPTGQVYTWAAGDACRADTTHPWGNLARNPNRAADAAALRGAHL